MNRLDTISNPASTRHSKAWLIGLLAALIPIAVAIYFLFVWQPQNSTQPYSPVILETQTQEPVSTPVPAIDTDSKTEVAPVTVYAGPPLPELNESNDAVLQALGNLYAGDEWLSWITTDEALRKLVVVIDNIADGKVARKYISIPKPKQPFKVNIEGKREYFQATTYDRYNHYIDIFDSMDVDLMAATYRHFLPLLEQGFAELGYPNRTFHSTVMRALDVILDAPIIQSGELELTHTSVLYKYADPKLERLSDVHKQILRMGPRNTAIAQRKIQALKKALGK
jgi:hypothetical protein